MNHIIPTSVKNGSGTGGTSGESDSTHLERQLPDGDDRRASAGHAPPSCTVVESHSQGVGMMLPLVSRN